jgi:hypothetical protein
LKRPFYYALTDPGNRRPISLLAAVSIILRPGFSAAAGDSNPISGQEFRGST